MERRYELPSEGLYGLKGIVPEGLFRRVEQVGGIPDSGPGSHSIPNTLESARRALIYPAVSTSKDQRRAWNQNNKIR